jgi:hypothetical protein
MMDFLAKLRDYLETDQDFQALWVAVNMLIDKLSVSEKDELLRRIAWMHVAQTIENCCMHQPILDMLVQTVNDEFSTECDTEQHE